MVEYLDRRKLGNCKDSAQAVDIVNFEPNNKLNDFISVILFQLLTLWYNFEAVLAY